MANIIYNNIIPFKGSKAITIWPLTFARKSSKPLKDYEENHEDIHLRQQLEVLIAAFVIDFILVMFLDLSLWWLLASLLVYYILYGIEWLIRLIIYRDVHMAYRNISTEQEAYVHQRDIDYLNHRRVFSWVKFIGQTTYRK